MFLVATVSKFYYGFNYVQKALHNSNITMCNIRIIHVIIKMPFFLIASLRSSGRVWRKIFVVNERKGKENYL